MSQQRAQTVDQAAIQDEELAGSHRRVRINHAMDLFIAAGHGAFWEGSLYASRATCRSALDRFYYDRVVSALS